MPEESGDKAGAPEHMELGSDDVMDNYSRSSEEIRDITVDIGMEPTTNPTKSEGEPCDILDELGVSLECDDTKESSGVRGEEACDIAADQGEIEADIIVGKTSQTSENSPIFSDARKKGVAVIVGANHKFNVRSRYLGSPVSSCHDSCKYGHRREAEDKISPLAIRGTRSLTRVNTIDVSKSATKDEIKKKKFLRRLSLPSSIEERDGDGEETPVVVSDSKKKEPKQSKLKRMQTEVKPKPSSVVTPKQTSSSKSENKPRNKVVVRNFNLLESASLGIKAIRTKKEVGSRSKSEKEKGKEPMNSNSSTFSPTLLKRSPSMKARLFKNVKSFSPSRSNLSKSKKANVDGSSEVVPEKTLYMIEPQTDKKPAKRGSRFSGSNEKSSLKSLRGSQGGKSSGSKGGQKEEGNHVGQPSSSTTTTDLSPSATVKEPSEILREDPPETGSVIDKQIGSIMEDGGSKSNTSRPKSTAKGGRSKPNTLRGKSNTQSSGGPTKSNVEQSGSNSKPGTLKAKPTVVANGGSKPSTPRAKSRGGSVGPRPSSSTAGPKSQGDGGSKPSTPRPKSTTSERRIKATNKGKASSPEDKDSSAWKVKFRKGTVVALQAASNAPKKLLFKRAKVLDHQADKTEAAARVVKGRERRGNEPHDSKQPESREVRLRHQETSSKKDTIDLNNVIEETASQLVKTRKSKVKALVGAFETVMSLRDRKPMVEAGAS